MKDDKQLRLEVFQAVMTQSGTGDAEIGRAIKTADLAYQWIISGSQPVGYVTNRATTSVIIPRGVYDMVYSILGQLDSDFIFISDIMKARESARNVRSMLAGL